MSGACSFELEVDRARAWSPFFNTYFTGGLRAFPRSPCFLNDSNEELKLTLVTRITAGAMATELLLRFSRGALHHCPDVNPSEEHRASNITGEWSALACWCPDQSSWR